MGGPLVARERERGGETQGDLEEIGAALTARERGGDPRRRGGDWCTPDGKREGGGTQGDVEEIGAPLTARERGGDPGRHGGDVWIPDGR